MWLSRAVVHPEQFARPPDPARYADLLAGWLSGVAPAPQLVVDGRAVAIRGGSTATYQLQVALGLTRAAPSAIWASDRQSAADALAALLATCPEGGVALLVATAPAAPFTTGSCLCAREPVEPGPVTVSRAMTSQIVASGSGLLDLIAAAAQAATPVALQPWRVGHE